VAPQPERQGLKTIHVSPWPGIPPVERINTAVMGSRSALFVADRHAGGHAAHVADLRSRIRVGVEVLDRLEHLVAVAKRYTVVVTGEAAPTSSKINRRRRQQPLALGGR
jgi:hypothetical protein